MPMKVKVKEQKLGAFLQLRCMLSYSGLILGEPEEFTTEDFVVNDLAMVCLHFEVKIGEPVVCRILALTHKQSEHCKVKVKVSCDSCQEDKAFYAEWICINEWKTIEKTKFSYLSLNNVHTTQFNINISASKVEESFLVKLYNDVDFTDFHLSADDGSVAVHRAHLAAHSDVFRAMLRQEWKETTEGSIQINGVSQQTLQHFKEYMYLRTLPEEGLESLLLLASYYLIDDLKAECVSKLTLNCKVGSWNSLLELAIDNKIPELICGLMLMSPALAIQQKDEKLYKRENNCCF